MELPQPPAEQELKNIIDKLAQFVARNGPEFEQMTKQKQKDNPKFSFLFGGEFFNYYQYRVTTEQAIIKQKQRTAEQQQAIVQHVVNQQSIQSAPWQQQQTQPPPPPQPTVAEMHEQIRQSEQNLAAQHQLLLQQQQVKVDEAIRKTQDEKLGKLAEECGLNLEDMDNVLQPIIDCCTKDSISNGKGWIFTNANTQNSCEVIVQYLLKKVTAPGAKFEAKLHLVYLINDVLHHCTRKNAEDLKKTLEHVVVPIFCSTSISADPDQQQKLLKLLKLWETNKYFCQEILEKLRNPVTSLATYQAGLIAECAPLLTPITTTIQNQYASLQKQHQDFVAHLTNQMHQLQQVPYAFQSQQNSMMAVHPSVVPTLPYSLMQQQPPPTLPMTQSQAHLPPTDPRKQPQVQAIQQQQQQQQSQVLSPPTVSEASPQVSQSQQPTTPVSQPSEEQNSPFAEAQTATTENNPEVPDTKENENSAMVSQSDDKDNTPQPPPSNDYGTPNILRHEPDYGDYPEDRMPPHIPLRPSNGQPPHSRFADDFSPRSGHPPHMGYMDMDMPPDYGMMTPPHMGAYGHPPLPPHYGPPHGMPPMAMNQHDDMPIRGFHGPPPEFLDPHMLPPTPPYYELPAGLMVPLIGLDETDYNLTIDPQDVRLPLPAPPTERLLAAVDLFYSPPSHDRARNSEGWEQLGLYEYFKAKSQAKKQKQGLNENTGSGEDSPEPTGFQLSGINSQSGSQDSLDKQPPRRRYREFKSPPKEAAPITPEAPPPQAGRNEGHSRPRSKSRSPPPPRRSRSHSPPPRHRSPPRRSPPHRSYSNRRSSRSPARTPPRSPPRERERSPRSRSPSPSRKRSPERSPTPPSFFGGAYGNPLDRRLDESNKGHQLLKKMGWSGAGGLGAAEQGIQDPVDAGDVRDRQDLYKGIGINLNDPYENFRKSKGQAFINRMKARAEELGKT